MRINEVKKGDFQFDRFVKSILDFHIPLASEHAQPSTFIMTIDPDGYAEWGPKKGLGRLF